MPYRPKIKNANGTLTDLPLAAETAVKLKTSRTIGLSGVTATSKSFNGTSSITIPITAIPASLLTGLDNINVGTATKLSEGWTSFTPGTTILPYGTYLIKVVIADGNSGIGNHITIITDVLSIDGTEQDLYVYRSYDLPMGPIHTYCANNYESTWFRSARIKVTGFVTAGFKLNLYVSTSGIYESTNVTGATLYPSKLASSLSNYSYTMYYKRIM